MIRLHIKAIRWIAVLYKLQH